VKSQLRTSWDRLQCSQPAASWESRTEQPSCRLQLGIITQNGNAYTDRFGPGVSALADWWKHRAAGHAAVDGFLTVNDTGVSGRPD
jgi:hypothetical protein